MLFKYTHHSGAWNQHFHKYISSKILLYYTNVVTNDTNVCVCVCVCLYYLLHTICNQTVVTITVCTP